MCFSFAAKMAADTNHLKELRECLRAGNEDSAKSKSKSKIKNGISKK